MAAIYWVSSNYTNTSNLTLWSIFQDCLCERVLRRNAAELSWVHLLTLHLLTIRKSTSPFTLLDLTDQMGHLTLVMEKKENKNKTSLEQFMDLSFFMEIMFSAEQGAFPLGKGL